VRAIAIVTACIALGCSDPCDVACADTVHVTAHSETAVAPSATAMVGLCIDQACGTGKYASATVQLSGVMTASATITPAATGIDVALDYEKGAMLHDGNVFGLDVYDDGARVSAISDPVTYVPACSCKTLDLEMTLMLRTAM
jgi:hypothetical protein